MSHAKEMMILELEESTRALLPVANEMTEEMEQHNLQKLIAEGKQAECY